MKIKILKSVIKNTAVSMMCVVCMFSAMQNLAAQSEDYTTISAKKVDFKYEDGKYIFFMKSTNIPLNGNYKMTTNKNVYLIANYENGIWSGPFSRFNKDGHKQGTFIDGILEGDFKTYDKNGNISKTEQYISGRRVGEIKYDNDGKIKRVEELNDSLGGGASNITYYSDGVIIKRLNYAVSVFPTQFTASMFKSTTDNTDNKYRSAKGTVAKTRQYDEANTQFIRYFLKYDSDYEYDSNYALGSNTRSELLKLDNNAKGHFVKVEDLEFTAKGVVTTSVLNQIINYKDGKPFSVTTVINGVFGEEVIIE